MRLKKAMAITMTAAMAMGMTACGDNAAKGTSSGSADNGTESSSADGDQSGTLSYADLVLGEDGTDLTATITMFNHRTDMDSEDYGGVNWKQYLEEFNKLYPNITVNISTSTGYADDALMHLQSGNYETIMGIPAIDKSDLGNYFIPYGDLETMQKEINYATAWEYGGEVYGVPSTATTQGIVYNKKVFEQAGITEIPTTPETFLAALEQIKDNTDAIPLYTNYAAGWTMGAWDAYIGNNATGDSTYMNQKLAHTKDPFRDYGDDTHAYAVYKVLYDAVADGLIEDDFTTTDWEGCKGMINNGEIGCMVLGSWAIPQMKAAGPNGEDIGYMPFPISIDGVQYATDGADYSYGINKNATAEEQEAAMVFVKWLTEESGFSYNEDGLPVDADSTETKLSFEGVTFVQDEPAVEGEEDLFNEMNAESELNFNSGGDYKVQEIIEHAYNGDKSFDEIMADWNEAWSNAQSALGVEVTE